MANQSPNELDNEIAGFTFRCAEMHFRDATLDSSPVDDFEWPSKVYIGTRRIGLS